MRFYVRKRRQPPAVIIVALIDVLIVVLIFLMVTTTFKKNQMALRLVLPESTRATPQQGSAERPPLTLGIDSKGVFHLGPDARVIPDDRLASELQAAVGVNPQLQLTIASDASAPVGKLVKVFDAVDAAHIKNTRMLSLKPAGQK